MRNLLLTASLLLLCFNYSRAQQTIQFYHALNDGNVFQYWVDYGGTIVGAVTVAVAGDTIMPNDKTYKIFESDIEAFFATRYLRVANEDSVLRYSSPDERLLYRLKLEVGVTWTLDDFFYQEITAIRDTTLFGHNFKYARISTFLSEDSTLGNPIDFLLADTLGVIIDFNEGGHEALTGAIINGKTYGTITSVISEEIASDDLGVVNYPNPFNQNTRISYRLASPGRVRIQILNLLGKEVSAFDVGLQQPGTYTKLWQAENHSGTPVSSGLYYYVIKSDNRVLYTGSMTLLK